MLLSVISVLALSRSLLAQPTDLQACGDAYYSSSKVIVSLMFFKTANILTVYLL
jgi:hypothetical protein